MLRLSNYLYLSFQYRLDLTVDQYTFVYNFFYGLVGLKPEKPYANNLFNGVRDLTASSKTEILASENKKRCLSFVNEWLIPSLQKINIADYFLKLESIISSDESIAPKIKDSFKKLYDENKIDVFLANALLYVVSKNNISSKKEIPVEDMELVFEVNKKCPICGKALVLTKSKIPMYRYGITNIFPPCLSSEKESAFVSIAPKPVDFNHKSNKICLCDCCASDYEECPTSDKFRIMVDKKYYLAQKATIDSSLDKAKLDEEIITVLSSLKNIKSFDGLAKFREKPLELKQKIYDNENLKEDIDDDVKKYYHFIRKQLSDLDDCDSEFRIIASQFQICYQKLSKSLTDQEEIYYKIVDWVLSELKLTDKYRTSSKIVVSFFVQNCEVFDEISK